MPRVTSGKLVLGAVLGAAALAAFPAVASAVPAHGYSHASTAVHRMGGTRKWFTGDTYPLTPAGLAACQAEGAYLVANGPYDAPAYNCSSGNPDPGLYNLWLTIVTA